MGVKFTNNAYTTLDSTISASATSFDLTSAAGFPTLAAGDWTYLSLTDEVVKVTAISGVTCTCDATSGGHSAGITVELRMTAELLSDFAEDLGSGYKGSDIASASPTVIGTDGDYFDVTGTTGFSAFTVAANRLFTLQFDDALTMTHHATNLDLPGEANITTAAGDVAQFFSTGTNTVQCVNYTRADGTPIAIADDAITYAKIQNVAADERILGRVSGANGVIEELTKAQVLTFVNVEDGATADQSASEIKTLLEDGIDSVHYVNGSIDNVHLADDAVDSDELAAGSVDTAHIAANQIDETLMKDAFVADFTEVTIASGDSLLLGDATDSGNTKRDTVQGVLDLVHDATIGTATMWIPSIAMLAPTTNPAEAATVETTATRPDLKVLDFDASTKQYAQFCVAFPKSWNLGTVTFQAYWTPGSTNAGNCIWGLQGLGCADGDTADAVYGTAQTSTDAGIGTVEDIQVSPLSSAITIAGTPADGDLTFFQVYRDAAAGGDTFSADARLLGVKIFFTTDAENDD
ncbi:MAG: hypothetical protein QGH83_10540 [Candidatus Pacebacteria bacterium]|nr:hypothetical protein [Candidatus Paceibacterota bacterium]